MPQLAFGAAVGHDAPVARQVLDAQRGILALAGFAFGVILTKVFGLVGFIVLVGVLLVGVPLFAVLAARHGAAPQDRRERRRPGSWRNLE
jgi:hypothetical protein